MSQPGENDSGIRIRQAVVADVDVIVSHRRCMFADMGYGEEAQREAMAVAARQFIESALQDGSYRGWLVEESERIIAGGGVAIVGFQPTPFDTNPRRAWILNMYTEPAYRRRGLATKLMRTMIVWSRQQGLSSIGLHASNAGRPLYERLGFKATNEMRLSLELPLGL